MSGRIRQRTHRGTTIAIALLIAVGAAACTDGDDAADAGTTTVGSTVPESYAAADSTDTTPSDRAAPASTVPASSPPGGSTPTPAVSTRCDPIATDGATTTLRVWHGMSGDVENLVLLLADRFEAEHPGINVEIERVASGYPAAIDQLRDTPDDQLPDVIMGSNQTVRLQADSGRFIPPAECNGGQEPEQFSDLLPVIRRTYTVGDTLQAAPFNVSAPVMLYDQKRWRRAGLDPDDPPSDFSELETTIRRLKDSGEAATGAVLYDRSSLWFIEQPASQAGRPLAEPANGHHGLTVDRLDFNHPDTVDVLTTLQELKRDGYILWSALNAGNEDLAQLVHPTEPSGLTFNSSAVIGDIIRLYEAGAIPDVEIGIAPFPGPGVGSTVGGGAWWLVDNQDPVRAGLAWILVDWLTRPELIAEVSAYTGYIPTTPRAAEHEVVQDRWAAWPVLRVAYEQALASADTDEAAGLQLGPLVEVYRNMELAAAFSIDAGNDPETELLNAEERSLELVRLYAESFPEDE